MELQNNKPLNCMGFCKGQFPKEKLYWLFQIKNSPPPLCCTSPGTAKIPLRFVCENATKKGQGS